MVSIDSAHLVQDVLRGAKRYTQRVVAFVVEVLRFFDNFFHALRPLHRGVIGRCHVLLLAVRRSPSPCRGNRVVLCLH